MTAISGRLAILIRLDAPLDELFLNHSMCGCCERFHIELERINPPVWRRIRVRSSYSFWDLHVAIQDAMGWLDCHLHLFHDIDLIAELEAAAPENIAVLSDGVLVLDGVRFLGSTLWTDFKLHGEGEAWFARERARRCMNDFVRIRNGGHKFRPEDSVVLHDASRTWLGIDITEDRARIRLMATARLQRASGHSSASSG